MSPNAMGDNPGSWRAELLCLVQEREIQRISREGTLLQDCEEIQVPLSHTDKEKNTWSELCSQALASIKGLEQEVETDIEKKEQEGGNTEKKNLEMQAQMQHKAEKKNQKLLEIKDSECAALKSKLLAVERSRVCYSCSSLTIQD